MGSALPSLLRHGWRCVGGFSCGQRRGTPRPRHPAIYPPACCCRPPQGGRLMAATQRRSARPSAMRWSRTGITPSRSGGLGRCAAVDPSWVRLGAWDELAGKAPAGRGLRPARLPTAALPHCPPCPTARPQGDPAARHGAGSDLGCGGTAVRGGPAGCQVPVVMSRYRRHMSTVAHARRPAAAAVASHLD